MKIKEQDLREIIKESLSNILSEKKWTGPYDDEDDDELQDFNYGKRKRDDYQKFEKIKKTKPSKSERDYLEEDIDGADDNDTICQIISTLKEQNERLADFLNQKDYEEASLLTRVSDLIESAIEKLEQAYGECK